MQFKGITGRFYFDDYIPSLKSGHCLNVMSKMFDKKSIFLFFNFLRKLILSYLFSSTGFPINVLRSLVKLFMQMNAMEFCALGRQQFLNIFEVPLIGGTPTSLSSSIWIRVL